MDEDTIRFILELPDEVVTLVVPLLPRETSRTPRFSFDSVSLPIPPAYDSAPKRFAPKSNLRAYAIGDGTYWDGVDVVVHESEKDPFQVLCVCRPDGTDIAGPRHMIDRLNRDYGEAAFCDIVRRAAMRIIE